MSLDSARLRPFLGSVFALRGMKNRTSPLDPPPTQHIDRSHSRYARRVMLGFVFGELSTEDRVVSDPCARLPAPPPSVLGSKLLQQLVHASVVHIKHLQVCWDLTAQSLATTNKISPAPDVFAKKLAAASKGSLLWEQWPKQAPAQLAQARRV